MKKKKAEYPNVIETFRGIGDYELAHLTDNSPSAFNGFVRVEKFRITIERINEPQDVYAARLTELWETCDNIHHMQPLKATAARLGVTLDHSKYGKRRKK